MGETLNDQQRAELREWISANLQPRKAINRHHTSYGLKHIAERCLGFYVSNDDMKAAMVACGFEAEQVSELNCSYNVSERSVRCAKLLSFAWWEIVVNGRG